MGSCGSAERDAGAPAPPPAAAQSAAAADAACSEQPMQLVTPACGDEPSSGSSRTEPSADAAKTPVPAKLPHSAEHPVAGAIPFRVTKLDGRVGCLTTGLEIVAVQPDSAAERAGLQPGMRVVRVDGQQVTADASLAALFRQAPETFTVDVRGETEPPVARAAAAAAPAPALVHRKAPPAVPAKRPDVDPPSPRHALSIGSSSLMDVRSSVPDVRSEPELLPPEPPAVAQRTLLCAAASAARAPRRRPCPAADPPRAACAAASSSAAAASPTAASAGHDEAETDAVRRTSAKRVSWDGSVSPAAASRGDAAAAGARRWASDEAEAAPQTGSSSSGPCPPPVGAQPTAERTSTPPPVVLLALPALPDAGRMEAGPPDRRWRDDDEPRSPDSWSSCRSPAQFADARQAEPAEVRTAPAVTARFADARRAEPAEMPAAVPARFADARQAEHAGMPARQAEHAGMLTAPAVTNETVVLCPLSPPSPVPLSPFGASRRAAAAAARRPRLRTPPPEARPHVATPILGSPHRPQPQRRAFTASGDTMRTPFSFTPTDSNPCAVVVRQDWPGQDDRRCVPLPPLATVPEPVPADEAVMERSVLRDRGDIFAVAPGRLPRPPAAAPGGSTTRWADPPPTTPSLPTDFTPSQLLRPGVAMRMVPDPPDEEYPADLLEGAAGECDDMSDEEEEEEEEEEEGVRWPPPPRPPSPPFSPLPGDVWGQLSPPSTGAAVAASRARRHGLLSPPHRQPHL
eukprot:TRINITY_DN6326_c0_g1_i3.p1 TRINITY_DN6326_c0_g1~~TRINITY_DN6326_c0_g1_i3.p1  ORF type:complete len:744 (+),score=194.78 TRINITY_DN6326_c0_g1_i3:41-2272(+)